MKRHDVNFLISILLLFSIIITGLLGFFQSRLELRMFLPHRYAAYTTLILATLHVCLNAGKIYRYFVSKLKRGQKAGL